MKDVTVAYVGDSTLIHSTLGLRAALLPMPSLALRGREAAAER